MPKSGNSFGKCGLNILKSLGLPRAQQNERSALTLLALANIGPRTSWKNVAQPLLRILDIMSFMRDKYGKDYAANSRETIRRQTIHPFEQARLVDRNPDDASRPTNSGKNCYALTDDIVNVLRAYETSRFQGKVDEFIASQGTLQATYSKKRKSKLVPLRLLNGKMVHLSPGKHNELQVAIIEELGPRFACGTTMLYVGDTAKKHVIYENSVIRTLRIPITKHDKLPDVVLYDAKKNWLFLIEAVTSHGPVNGKRYVELEQFLAKCSANCIYITAFLTRAEFRKYAAEIAWETEVWIKENPDHMIRFNGPKFLGSYQAESGR